MFNIMKLSSRLCASIKHNFVALLLLTLFVSSASAQSFSTNQLDGHTPSGLTPGRPVGSYQLSGFENVNPYNGNLSFSLPLLSVGGRGGAGYTLQLPIEHHWVVNHNHIDGDGTGMASQDSWFPSLYGSWAPNYLPGKMVINYGGEGAQWCQSSQNYTYGFTLTRLTFITTDGTQYELRDQLTGGRPFSVSPCVETGGSRGTVFVTADGTSATFISDSPIYDSPLFGAAGYPSGYLILRDGTRYRFGILGEVKWMRDRNGNMITFEKTGQSFNDRNNIIRDSLNREITTENHFSYNQATTEVEDYGDTITYKGFDGTQRNIEVIKTTLDTALRPANSEHPAEVIKSLYQLFPQAYDSSATLQSNPRVISSVIMPDGRRYKFYYNSYAELARVELPTGGAYEYDWAAGANALPPSGMAPLGNNCYVYRRIVERRVYADGQHLESKMVFERPETQTVNANSFLYDTTVRVVHYNAAGAPLFSEKHYYYGSAEISLSGPNSTPITYTPWKEGREYKTEVFNENNLRLRTITRHWVQRAPVSWVTGDPDYAPPNDPRMDETTTTLEDTGQVTRQAFDYDQYNNQTDVWEYDYGPGVAGPLLRHTHTDYVSSATPINGVDYTSVTVGVHIRSLASQVIVYDGTESEVAHTSYEYDNYTPDAGLKHALLQPRASISGLCTKFNPAGVDPTGKCLDASDPGYEEPDNYKTRGNVTAVTQSIRHNGTVTGSISIYRQYDVAGNVVQAIDGRGYATNFYFDDCFGTPNEEARANLAPASLGTLKTYAFVTRVSNARGHETRTQYDYHLGLPVNTEDANGTIISISYNDVLDRMTLVERAVNVAALRNRTVTGYDDTAHRITTTSDLNSLGDQLLKSESFYDGLGRTTENRQYESATEYIITGRQAYDALGRVEYSYNPYRTTSDSTYGWSRTTYDALSRATRVETFDANGISTGALKTEYTGNKLKIEDQAGKVRASLTDALGRLVEVTEPNASGNLNAADSLLTVYSYDALNNLRQVRQGGQRQNNVYVGGQTRTFVYDSLSRLTAAINPESGTITYQYDENGNLKTKSDPRLLSDNVTHITTTYDYDELNRQTTRTYNDGTPNVTYTYDTTVNGKGRLSSVSSSVSASNYAGYDALGHVTGSSQVTDGVTYSMPDYKYDRAGNLISEQYPSGKIITTNYDVAGRIAGVKNEATGVYYAGAGSADANRFQYAAHGALSALRLGNGLWEHTNFNSRLQTTQIGVGTSSVDSTTLRLDYAYGTTDNNGNVRSQTINTPGAASPLVQTYAYDALNRLQSAEEMNASTSAWKQVYAYDQYGNRRLSTGTTSPGQLNETTSPEISPDNNRITSPGYTYDSAGNLQCDPAHPCAQTPGFVAYYTYNAENLIKAAGGVPSNGGAAYAYDGDERRVRKVVGNVTTIFVYDAGGHLVAEYSNSTAQQGSGGTSYLTDDSLASSRVITDQSGNVKARHDYLPFGEEIAVGVGGRTAGQKYIYGMGDDGVRQKFGQYERDIETGLDYAQARYYANSHGRFTSPDPLLASGVAVNPKTWNRYPYALNNPLRFTDPTGLEASADDKEPEPQQAPPPQNADASRSNGDPEDARVDRDLTQLFTDGTGIVRGADSIRNESGRDTHYMLADGTVHTFHVYGNENATARTGLYVPKEFSQIEWVGGSTVVATNPKTGEVLNFNHVLKTPGEKPNNEAGSRYIGQIGGSGATRPGDIHSHVTLYRDRKSRNATESWRMEPTKQIKAGTPGFPRTIDSSQSKNIRDIRSLVQRR